MTIDELKEMLDTDELRKIYSKQGSGYSNQSIPKDEGEEPDIWTELMNQVDTNKDGKVLVFLTLFYSLNFFS